MRRSLLFALPLVLAAATAANAQSQGRLSVSVAGVRNDNGAVRCGLYSSANGFREPGKEMRGAVAPIKNGQATCVFSGVPSGTELLTRVARLRGACGGAARRRTVSSFPLHDVKQPTRLR